MVGHGRSKDGTLRFRMLPDDWTRRAAAAVAAGDEQSYPRVFMQIYVHGLYKCTSNSRSYSGCFMKISDPNFTNGPLIRIAITNRNPN